MKYDFNYTDENKFVRNTNPRVPRLYKVIF